MKRLACVLIVALVAGTLCWSAELYVPEQTITELKTYYPDTTLVENGEAACVIIHPAEEGYAELGAEVAAGIKAATGAEVPVKSDKDYSEADHATNLICLGRMNNNKLSLDLYIWHYVACDDWFPGPGDEEHAPGFVVRSCCDPWGTGKNVIMLGGTELDGVKLAVERFKGMIAKGQTLTIPRTVEVHFKGTENLEEFARTIEPTYHKGFIDLKALPYGGEYKMVEAAERYFLTGRDEYLTCYALMMRRWMDEYYKWVPHRQITTPKYIIPAMLMSYDQIEESPLLPDDLKLEMTNLLYDYVSRMSVHGRITQLTPGVLADTGLHNVSMTVIYGGKYFKKYYPEADFARIDKGIASVTVGQQTMANSHGFIDNNGGYTASYPRTSVMLAPAMNNYQYFESAARKYMEYCFIITGGRAGAIFGRQPTPGIIAWYTKDPTYVWYHNWRHGKKTYYSEMTAGDIKATLWSYLPNMEERVPEEMIGLHYLPLHETNYEQLKRGNKLINVPRERSFHQLCMRTGFTRDDQYLRLDGINDGIANGGDGNTIAWITQGRDWLTATGKWGGGRNMKYYSTCLVLKDGQMADKLVALCDLQAASELPTSGFVRSVMHEYNGMDWARNIVWIKDKYWVIFDQLQVLEPDDYSVLCQWFPLGGTVDESHSVTVTSYDHSLYLQMPGGSKPFVKAIEPGDARTAFRQGISGQLAVGDEPTFATIFYGHHKNVPDEYSMKRISDNTCLVTEPEREVLVGVAPLGKPDETMVLGPDVQVKCTGFALAADEMALFGLTSFGAKEPLLVADKPIGLAIDFTAGIITVQAAEPTELKVLTPGGEAGVRVTMPLEAGRHELPARGGPFAALTQAVRDIVAKAAAAPAQTAQAAQAQYPQKLDMEWEFQIPAEDKVAVRCLETADLDGDGAEEVLVGTSDGRVILVKADGSLAGESFFQAEGGINDIAVTDFGEGNRILVASDDEHLYCLDGASLEWKFTGAGIECTNQAPGTYGPGRYVEGDGEMIAIDVADINADGTKEILVGSKTFKHGSRRVFGTLWCLSPDGKLLWHLYQSAGTVTSVKAFDDTGDGQMKIAIESGGGTYGVGGYLVDNQGAMLNRQSAGYGERFCDVAKIAPDGAYRKVRADHRTGITDVFETADPYAKKWSFKASGLSAMGPVVTDLDGNGISEILVGSGGGSLFCLNEGEEPLTWRVNLGEPISALATGTLQGAGVQVIAGANTGGVYVVSAEGKCLARAGMGAPVSCIATARFAAKDNLTVIVATDQGRLVAFRLQ